jgi:hypothetical protein
MPSALPFARSQYRKVNACGARRPGRRSCELRDSRVAVLPDHQHDRRLKHIQAACDVLADGFIDLEEHIETYVSEVSLAACETADLDVERFFDWLDEHVDLTDADRDYLRCQRSRHAVERVALRKRLSHVRFQALLARNDAPEGFQLRMQDVIYLNPIHVWARYETRALLDDDVDVPALVVFFPVGDEIRTAVVDDCAADLLRRLGQEGPLPLRQLTGWVSHDERDRMCAALCELTCAGLVAIA